MVPVALLGAVVLAVPQNVSVVVTRHEGLGEVESAVLADRVSSALGNAGLRVRVGPAAAAERLEQAHVRPGEHCRPADACAVRTGQALGTPVVVTVEMGTLTNTVALHLEARASSDGTRLAQHSAVVPREAEAAAMSLDLEEFASQVQEGIRMLDEANQGRSARRGRRIGALVTGGFALAAAGTATTFLLLGLGESGDLERGTTPAGQPTVGLSEREARDTASAANRDYTISAIAAATTAALAALTVFLFAGTSEQGPAPTAN